MRCMSVLVLWAHRGTLRISLITEHQLTSYKTGHWGPYNLEIQHRSHLKCYRLRIDGVTPIDGKEIFRSVANEKLIMLATGQTEE